MVPHYYNNILSRTETATVDGDGATLVTPTSPVNRGGIQVTNADETMKIGLYAQKVSAAAPVLTSIDGCMIVSPQTTVCLLYSKDLEVYAINDSAAATTSLVVVEELG